MAGYGLVSVEVNACWSETTNLLRRNWSSLRAGIQSVSDLCNYSQDENSLKPQVLTLMQSWKYESIFAEFITEEDLVGTSFRTHRRRPSVNPTERGAILHQTAQALQRVQIALVGHELELHWLNQIITYIQRLQSLNPPQTAEEQFSQLYYLRKWLFWVPVSLLQRPAGQGPAMLTLAHFYATALILEPLFPDLGSSFCSALGLPPLEAIIRGTNAMQSEQIVTPGSNEIATLMHFPQQVALSYRTRAIQTQQLAMQQDSPMVNISPETFNYASMGNLSPAFAPSPLHYGTPQSASSIQSPFLEVPTSHAGFTYGMQSWGVAPSPGLPAQTYGSQDEQMYGYMSSMGGFRGGFVQPAPIWT